LSEPTFQILTSKRVQKLKNLAENLAKIWRKTSKVEKFGGKFGENLAENFKS
jgi:hypothetical protein